jgi:hypothetical protein
MKSPVWADLNHLLLLKEREVVSIERSGGVENHRNTLLGSRASYKDMSVAV